MSLSTANDNESDTGANDWKDYDRFVASHIDRSVRQSNVEGSVVSEEELCWSAVLQRDMPRIEDAPPIVLPLHIHLSRGSHLGCELSIEECREEIVPRLNEIWRSVANISFDLVTVSEHEWPEEVSGTSQGELRRQIWNLSRDRASGKMNGKDVRRDIFINKLIGQANINPTTYDVWIFDFIGMKSQGCCIDRFNRVIIMGQRSTKGYIEPTLRPLTGLAKTMAHELGHALGLNHPKGRKFKDGTTQTVDTARNNLMIGGVDETGGGGELLCRWQVLLARHFALKFLTTLPILRSIEGDVTYGNTNLDQQCLSPCDPEEDGVKQLSLNTVTKVVNDIQDPGNLRIPSRTVLQLDALEWLNQYPDELLPGEVFTSVPDISELETLFPAPHKNIQNFQLYKSWFREAVRLIFTKTPRYAIFLQTDIRALIGKDDKVFEFIDKSAIIQEVAVTCHFNLVWHKIVTNSEKNSQKRVSHSPNWSHLLCFQREGVPFYETRRWKTPDVFTRGDMTWERAVGMNAAMTGVSFLKHIAEAHTVVDPFCGLGTILAIANALNMNSLGNDLSRKRVKKAAKLDLRYALCCLSYKQREHYGVVERLPYSKDSVPKPYVWSPADNNNTEHSSECSFHNESGSSGENGNVV